MYNDCDGKANEHFLFSTISLISIARRSLILKKSSKSLVLAKHLTKISIELAENSFIFTITGVLFVTKNLYYY